MPFLFWAMDGPDNIFFQKRKLPQCMYHLSKVAELVGLTHTPQKYPRYQYPFMLGITNHYKRCTLRSQMTPTPELMGNIPSGCVTYQTIDYLETLGPWQFDFANWNWSIAFNSHIDSSDGIWSPGHRLLYSFYRCDFIWTLKLIFVLFHMSLYLLYAWIRHFYTLIVE